MRRTDENLLERMCKPLGVSDKLRLDTGDGVIEDERFWIRFRDPSGPESDELQATQTRDVISEEYDVDPDDIEKTRVRSVRYSETRRIPLLLKAVELGLVVDANLPSFNKKTGEINVYKWSVNNDDNIQFVRKQNPDYTNTLWYMVVKHVLALSLNSMVMSEGEGSADVQGTSTSGSTETTESEEI